MLAEKTKRFYLQVAGILIFAAVVGVGLNAVGGIPLVGNWDAPKKVHQGENLPETAGIHYVDIKAARFFYENKLGVIADARDPEVYREGHIPGAVLCTFYLLEKYLPDFVAAVEYDIPLLVYCHDNGCGDSGFLAQALKGVGYRLIYVFPGGYREWHKAELPLELGASQDKPLPESLDIGGVLDFTSLLPEGAWLYIDLLILLYGLAVLYLMISGRREHLVVVIGLKLLGALFVVASLHKIGSPLIFAQIIHNYKILPDMLVNFTAILMPWVEITCGILLVMGRFRQAAALLLLCLIGTFILAVGFNLMRGLDFDCGCFGAGHTPPWQILMRDAGLFLCCLPGVSGIDVET
ncbi:MauE/DoxX family redox-associated membrane protein [Gemmatimonadota bacterium]